MLTTEPAPTGAAAIAKSSSNSFAVLKQITAACHAVQNVVFEAPKPKPEWFDTLAGHLKEAQNLCGQWIDMEPDLTGNIPAQILQAYGLFSVMRSQADELLNSAADKPFSGPDDPRVLDLRNMISDFQNAISQPDLSPVAAVESMQTKLLNWGNALQTVPTDLKQGTASIQAAETDLSVAIENFQNNITHMQAEIASYNKAFDAGLGLATAGIIIGVVAISIAPEAAAVSVPAMLTAGALFAGGVGIDIYFDTKISGCFDQISTDQKGITADQTQLVALQGLGTAADQAIRGLEDATSSLSDLRTSWASLDKELTNALKDLDKIKENDKPSAFLDKLELGGSAADWDGAKAFAEKLQTMEVQITQIPITITKKAA